MDTDRSPSASLCAALQQLAATAEDGPAAIGVLQTRRLAEEHGCAVGDVERAALASGVLPERYRRNLGTVGWEGQRRLLASTVAVVGAGGIGGWVIEGLARMGVGRLVVIDCDRFEENNLNRQLGCTERTLGLPKAEVLAERAAQVNAAVMVTPHVARLDASNASHLLRGAQVVVDALDTLPARMDLQRAAQALGIPMVHGAIAGYSCQVTTVMPGDAGLTALYGDAVPERGIETTLGNPSATPMMVAAWQIHEVIKLLIGAEHILRARLLMMDAEFGEFGEIELG
ncbi:MAG TPA: HesA/MoeB/ThiF family protein [Chloroflexi bacterium]|nr:HesA/MoeB/ThiF family protein [Chloroflexota bacterium]